MLRAFVGIASVASSSKVFNLIASPKMIKTPQNLVEGSFPIKMTKICIKVGVKS